MITLRDVVQYCESVTGLPCAAEQTDIRKVTVKVRGPISAEHSCQIVSWLVERIPAYTTVDVEEDWS